MKRELFLTKKLENEIRRIRREIDKQKDREKQAKMIKAYRRLLKTLI